MNDHSPGNINAEYGTAGLSSRVEAALKQAGMDSRQLTPEDLAPLDHFHTGGVNATRQLAGRLGLKAGMAILDLGGGIGGPARTLASELQCSVTVLELTAEFCQVGRLLTGRLGLDGLIEFREGSALEIPFESASFDIVWSQNVFMNIEDKAHLFQGIERVLRPGGRLGFQDAVAGDVQPLYYPVNWATTAAISHLLPPESLRRIATDAGLKEIEWEDVTPGVLLAADRQQLLRRLRKHDNVSRYFPTSFIRRRTQTSGEPMACAIFAKVDCGGSKQFWRRSQANWSIRVTR